MRDPFMPPFLTLVGIALTFWGWRKLRASFRKQRADFRSDPRGGMGRRIEAPLARASETLDALTFLFAGGVVFAFGVVDLLSLF